MPLSHAAKAALAKARADNATRARAARTAGTVGAGRADPAQLALHLKGVPELPNPLDDAAVTGDEEVDGLAELAALGDAVNDASGFIARAQREDTRYANATETRFYFTVGFLSAADKNRFLAAAGLVPAELYGDMFLDGYQMAAQLGIDVSQE